MKKKKAIIFLLILFLIIISIVVLGTQTTILESLTGRIENANASGSTTYYHLDLRVDTNYELPATTGYSAVTGKVASINTISVTDSDGGTIEITMDSATSEDENDGSTEYKSVKGHGGPNGENLSLTEGDYVTISLDFTYEDYDGNEITKAVNANIVLNEETNECSGNSGETYGYDFTIYVQDYIDAAIAEVEEIYGYTIYYWYDGVKDASETITASAVLNSTVNYTEKDKSGTYTLDSGATGDTTMTITSTIADNVLNIYYVSATTPTYDYTINYYYDDVLDSNETITGSSTEGQTITYTEKTKNGTYELDTENTKATEMTISSTSDNVLNIYYKSVSTPTYSYTINYYYDETQDTDETITGTAEEGDKITYTEKTKNGTYELDTSSTKATSMTISSTESENVLNIYYISVKETGTIVVKYMDITTSTEIADQETITGTVGTEYKTEQKEISGYTYASVSGDATGTIEEGTTTVIYYYTEDEDEPVANTVTVKYIDADTGKEIADTVTITGNVGDSYTTKQKDIDGYTFKSVSGDTTGTITEEGINVTYYYTADEETTTNLINTTKNSTNTVTSLPYTGSTFAKILLCVGMVVIGITAFLKLSIYKDEH